MKRQTDRNVPVSSRTCWSWRILGGWWRWSWRTRIGAWRSRWSGPRASRRPAPSAGGLARCTTMPRRAGGGIWTRWTARPGFAAACPAASARRTEWGRCRCLGRDRVRVSLRSSRSRWWICCCSPAASRRRRSIWNWTGTRCTRCRRRRSGGDWRGVTRRISRGSGSTRRVSAAGITTGRCWPTWTTAACWRWSSTARWAGNSPAVVSMNYLGAATPDDARAFLFAGARKWFASRTVPRRDGTKWTGGAIAKSAATGRAGSQIRGQYWAI